MMNIVLLSFSLLHVNHGLNTGDFTTISGAVWEYYQGDCGGQDIVAYGVRRVGESGWESDREMCARECVARDNCVAFNYPSPGNGNCWLKYNPNRQESQRLGASCDNEYTSSSWQYYTKIGTETPEPTTTAQPTTPTPTTAEPTTAAPTHACDGVVCPDGLICEGGECQRNCAMFQIDEYLLDCSDEFDSNTNDIGTLQTAVVDVNNRIDTVDNKVDINAGDISSIIDELVDVKQNILLNDENIGDILLRLSVAENNITSLADDIDSEATNIETINIELSQIQAEIDTINSQLIAYRANAPQSISLISDKDIKGQPLLSPDTKDTLIIALLLLNVVTIVGGIIVYCSCKNSHRHRYSKVNEVSYTTDDEHQQLSK